MARFVGSDDNPTAPGKAMTTCAAREICADLYNEIVTLRPDWHSGDAAHTPPISNHVRRDSATAAIEKRIKDIDDEHRAACCRES